MAKITRLYTFQDGQKAYSSQVNAELDQLVNAHNSQDTSITDLSSTTDGNSGADKVGATPITGGTANTVQGILEELKALDSLKTPIVGAKIQGFDTVAPTPVASVGDMSWNTGRETLDIKLSQTVVGQAFQETHLYVRNTTASTIPDGTLVMRTGINSDRITVAPAVCDGSVPASDILGVTTEDILRNSNGRVTVFGEINGLNTSAYTIGTELWGDPSVAGGLTSTKPSAPNLKVSVGIVTKSHGTHGILLVNMNNGSVLGGTDSNVQLTGLADKDLLSYESATGIWKNKTIADAGAVALTGNQTISDVKTFSSSPVVPTPTTDMQASTKKYVDDKDASRKTYIDNADALKADKATTYTKTNMQTSGEALLHWGNLTNVPNFGDPHWKSPVANRAALPLVGNSIEDTRTVLDDGDGKQAIYNCIATTGTVDQQWAKVADVDWMTEEATRVTQENARVSAENSRVTAESGRVSAENTRASNETSRSSAESTRVSQENSRKSAETSRVSAESSRVTAETNRANAETSRASAESSRVTAETNRATAETNRANAESSRATAETGRVNAESGRVTAESGRVSAEASRVSAEENRTLRLTKVEDSVADVIESTKTVIPDVSVSTYSKVSSLSSNAREGQMNVKVSGNTAKNLVSGKGIINGGTVTFPTVSGNKYYISLGSTIITGDGNNYTVTNSSGATVDIWVVDLTSLNLATLTAPDCALRFPEYFDGLASVVAGSVKTVGKNLFDGQLKLGIINATTGAIEASATDSITVNNIICKSSTSYMISGLTYGGGSNSHRVYYYDANLNFLGYGGSVVTSSFTFTTPANCKILRFRQSHSNLLLNVIQIEEGTTATQYEPYTETLRPLPSATLRSLPNGVKDYVDGNRLVQNTKEYVLQASDVITLNTSGVNVDTVSTSKVFSDATTWSFSAIDPIYIGSMPQFLHYGVWDNASFAGKFNSVNSSGNYINFYVAKGTYADLASAKTALTGTKVIYQLATPITTELLPSPLKSSPKGSVIYTNIRTEIGTYTTNATVSNTSAPIKTMNRLWKILVDGTRMPLSVVTGIAIAGDKLSFTHTGLASGDRIEWEYEFDSALSTTPLLEYGYENEKGDFPATNLVVNGSFVSTTGWTSTGCTLSASNNVLSSTGDGTANNPYFNANITATSLNNEKLYTICKARVTNANCTHFAVYPRYTGTIGIPRVGVSGISSPAIDQWYTLSMVSTSNTGDSGYTTGVIILGQHVYADNATANGKVMEVKEVLTINLTTVFGSGSEPTKEEMDSILALYPNSWFDGTVNPLLTSKQIWNLKAGKTQEGWITPTLLNGWTSVEGYPVAYRKNQFGIVEFKGRITGGTSGAFLLPATHRTSVENRQPVTDLGGTIRTAAVYANGYFYPTMSTYTTSVDITGVTISTT